MFYFVRRGSRDQSLWQRQSAFVFLSKFFCTEKEGIEYEGYLSSCELPKGPFKYKISALRGEVAFQPNTVVVLLGFPKAILTFIP